MLLLYDISIKYFEDKNEYLDFHHKSANSVGGKAEAEKKGSPHGQRNNILLSFVSTFIYIRDKLTGIQRIYSVRFKSRRII